MRHGLLLLLLAALVHGVECHAQECDQQQPESPLNSAIVNLKFFLIEYVEYEFNKERASNPDLVSLNSSILINIKEMIEKASRIAESKGDSQFLRIASRIEGKLDRVDIKWLSNKHYACVGRSDGYSIPVFKNRTIYLCESLIHSTLSYQTQVAVHEMVHIVGIGRGERMARNFERKYVEYIND